MLAFLILYAIVTSIGVYSLNQTSTAPPPPPQDFYEFTMFFQNNTLGSCNSIVEEGPTFYCSSQTISVGSFLYENPDGTGPVESGWYGFDDASMLFSCHVISNGEIDIVLPCSGGLDAPNATVENITYRGADFDVDPRINGVVYTYTINGSSDIFTLGPVSQTDNTLTDNTDYTIRFLATRTSDNFTSASTEVFITLLIKPTGLIIDNITQTTANLSFSRDYLTNDVMYYYTIVGPGKNVNDHYDISENITLIDGLEAYSQYSVIVYAYRDSDEYLIGSEANDFETLENT